MESTCASGQGGRQQWNQLMFTSLTGRQEASQPNVLLLADALQAAIDQLDLLGAVTQKEGQVVLTPLGKKMAAFPLDPKFSKVKAAEKLTFLISCTHLCTINVSL